MAYRLIFGEFIEPGSRDSWSRILSMKTGGDVDHFREEIKKRLSKPWLDSIPTTVVAELEKARDDCLKAGQFEEALDKFWLIGEVAGRFSSENLSVVFDGLKSAGLMKHALAISFMLEGGCSRFCEEIYEPGHLLGSTNADDWKTRKTDFALMSPYFENFLLIDESTSWIDRFIREAELYEAFSKFQGLTINGYANEDVFFAFLDGIGQNPILMELFQASAKLYVMKPPDRKFLLLFIDLLYFIENEVYCERRTVIKFREQKWFEQLMKNLSVALVSEPGFAKTLAFDEAPELFLQFCVLLWTYGYDMSIAEERFTYDFECSLSWLCDASILFAISSGKQNVDWEDEYLQSPSPYAIANVYLEEADDYLLDNIEDMSLLECKAALELQILLGAINFVEWKGALIGVITSDMESSFRSAYTSWGLLGWVLDGQRNFVIQVAKSSKWELLLRHESYFMQLVFRLQFMANNVKRSSSPAFEEQLKLVASCFDVFNTKAFSGVQDVAAIVEIEEFKEMLIDATEKLLFHYGQTEIEVLDRLLDVVALCCSASLVFRQCFTKKSHDIAFKSLILRQAENCSPRLVATLLRTADASLRQRWAPHLENYAIVVVAYMKDFSAMNLLSKTNMLLAMQAIVGQRPTPLIPLSNVFKMLQESSFTPIFDQFISALNPATAGCFVVDADGKENVLFKKTGVLAAGILLATLVTESRGTSYFASLTRWKTGRKLLEKEMRRALAFLTLYTPSKN